MNTQTRLTLAIALSCGTIAIGAWTYTQQGRGTQVECDDQTLAGSTIGGPFSLIDGTGATRTDQDVITEPSLVYFGYTFCPDVCPLDAARNVAAVTLLEEQELSATPVFITVDPDRDTPEVVSDFAQNFHPKMIGLTGSDAQIKQASKAYKTFYQKQGGDPDYYLMQHTSFTYLMFPGNELKAFYRSGETAENVAQSVACHIKNS